MKSTAGPCIKNFLKEPIMTYLFSSKKVPIPSLLPECLLCSKNTSFFKSSWQCNYALLVLCHMSTSHYLLFRLCSSILQTHVSCLSRISLYEHPYLHTYRLLDLPSRLSRYCNLRSTSFHLGRWQLLWSSYSLKKVLPSTLQSPQWTDPTLFSFRFQKDPTADKTSLLGST